MVRVRRKKQKRQEGLDVKTGKSVPVITKRGAKEKTLEKKPDRQSVEKKDLNVEREGAEQQEAGRVQQSVQSNIPLLEELDTGDNKGILEKANEFLKDPLKGESLATAALGAAESALGTEGVGLQVSSQTAHEIGTGVLFSPLLTARSKTLVSQKAVQVMGRADPNFVVKFFGKKGDKAAVSIRFPHTLKSDTLTKGWLTKVGYGVLAAGGLVTLIGTYPFAGFLREEALQQMGFGFNEADRNNDIDAMEAAVQVNEEILNPTAWERLLSKIPFVNVLSELQKFYKAAELKLQIDKRLIESKRAEGL